MIQLPWHRPDDGEEKLKQARLIAAYKHLFLKTDETGQSVLADICSYGMIDQSTFNPDPNIAAFNQGKRDVCLMILSKLNINVVDFLTESVVTEDI